MVYEGQYPLKLKGWNRAINTQSAESVVMGASLSEIQDDRSPVLTGNYLAPSRLRAWEGQMQSRDDARLYGGWQR